MAGGRARTLASRATTAAVASAAGTARRATRAGAHHANPSLMMWRRGTPARRRLVRVASVMLRGPQT